MSPSIIIRLLAFSLCTAVTALPQTATVSAGVPLRITLDHRLKIAHAGAPVDGHLSTPVYAGDRLAIPAGTAAIGSITAVRAAPRREHFDMLMRGDFTPPRQPRIEFQKLVLPDGRALIIHTAAAEPSGDMIHMQDSTQRQRIKQRVKSLIEQRKEEAIQTIKADHKWDRVKDLVKDQLLLSLPYHPQWIDAGAAYDARLDTPLEVPVAAVPNPDLSELGARIPPNSILHARLLSAVSSATNKQGSAVSAELTDPLFDTATASGNQRRLLLPQGTLLHGTVMRAKPARRLARNGQLRFIFTSIELPGTFTRTMHGQVTATEGDPKAHLKLDSEGAAQAQPEKNKYLAPLTLAVLATAAQNDDEGGGPQSFLAGGFGLIGRVVVLAARSTPVSSSFAYYGLSRSVYSRLIARGHDVTFPKDTRLEIQVGAR